MGIGGGFLLVPMLIYFLRVPTATVIGTSMVLTLITMASATVMHAATNHLVDAVLALILMVGGVIASVPVLIMYIIAQRFVIEGVSRSGLKG